ncbi:MAG: DUF6159 family protein [Anaerolineae bacterium]
MGAGQSQLGGAARGQGADRLSNRLDDRHGHRDDPVRCPGDHGGWLDSVTQGRGDGIASLIVGFLFYVVVYMIIFYANTALVGAAMIRLRGGDPTLSDGFRIASSHAMSILGYAVISATVGMISTPCRAAPGSSGRSSSRSSAFAWNVATFLVVPVLVMEEVGPSTPSSAAPPTQADLGRAVIGNFSIGMVFALIGFAVAAVIGVPLSALAGSADLPALVVVAILVIVLPFVVIGVISSTPKGIFTAALYRYAITVRNVSGALQGRCDDQGRLPAEVSPANSVCMSVLGDLLAAFLFDAAAAANGHAGAQRASGAVPADLT